MVKGTKKKHRWATVKGRVVSVRFADYEYKVVEARAREHGLSSGEYLKWLSMKHWEEEERRWREEERRLVDERY